MTRPAHDPLPERYVTGRPALSNPTALDPAADARLRVLLANTPLPEPEPQRVRRWQTRLAALRTPTRRRYRAAASAAGLATAALAAGIVALTLAGVPTDGLTGARPAAEPLSLTRGQLPGATPTGLDLGPLADPATRAACLVGTGAVGEPLAGRPVVLDGRRGELLVLPTERPGRLRLLVVADGCGPAGTEVLADDIVGR